MDFHLYANDTQLYATFSCDDDDDLTTTISLIESCLVDITNWMTTNKLKLNTDETNFSFSILSSDCPHGYLLLK